MSQPLARRLRLGIRGAIRRLGWDLVPYDHLSSDSYRQKLLLEREGIDLVIDVGANTGQFARDLRAAGYAGRIASFEPLKEAFDLLAESSKDDANWSCWNLALGDRCEELTIHIAGNSVSSSVLAMLPQHLKSAPSSRYTGEMKVRCQTLDAIWPEVAREARRPYLKMDVQGFEMNVLLGGQRILERVVAVRSELSLVPLYEGGSLYWEMIRFLAEAGFSLFSLERGFSDPRSGQLLQVDGVFVRAAMGAAENWSRRHTGVRGGQAR